VELDNTKANGSASTTTRAVREQAATAITTQVESAKDQLRSFAEMGKDQVAERLDTVARAIRSTGETLRNEEQAQLSQYTEYVGDAMENASRYLREHGTADLAHEVERVARMQPLAFVGGAFIVGLAIGRFLKSSTPSDGSSSVTGGSPEPEESSGYGASSYGTTPAYGTSNFGSPTSYGSSSSSYGSTTLPYGTPATQGSPSTRGSVGSTGTGSTYGTGSSGTGSTYGTGTAGSSTPGSTTGSTSSSTTPSTTSSVSPSSAPPRVTPYSSPYVSPSGKPGSSDNNGS
jgi:hypothetical protein